MKAGDTVRFRQADGSFSEPMRVAIARARPWGWELELSGGQKRIVVPASKCVLEVAAAPAQVDVGAKPDPGEIR